MDRISSILAAWRAGKLPSQSQITWSVQWLKMSLVTQIEGNDLSPRALMLVKDIYNLLDAFVNLCERKNPDNIIQNTIHRCMSLFSASTAIDIDNPSIPVEDDISGLRQPFFYLVQMVWSAMSSENRLSWTSMGSAALSEAAHIVGKVGQKEAGTTAMDGIRQSVLPRLKSIILQLSELTQKEEPYRKALSTFFDLLRKWTFFSLNKTFYQEDSPSQFLFSLRTILERFASRSSVAQLFSALHLCASSICDDPKVRQWFEDGFSFLHRALDEAGFVGSDEWHTTSAQLQLRWKVLPEDNPTWKQNIDSLYSVWEVVIKAIQEDVDLQIFKITYQKLFEDYKSGMNTTDPPGQLGILSQLSWIWEDIFKVLLPILLGTIRDIPIPRVEYCDSQMEFVLENLDLSSLRIHPTHVHLSNMTNIELNTTETGETKSSLSIVTQLHARGIRVSINKLSFWYRDKTAMYGPSDYSGRIYNFIVPPQGIDLDMRFKLIPANPGTSTSVERQRRKAFHILERVQVTFVEGQDMDFDVDDCNHPVLLSLFKPLFVTRLREALEITLTEQVRLLFEGLDSMAWDVFQMTQEYALVGMGFRSSVKTAISEEWDHFKHAHEARADGAGTMFTSSGIIVRIRDPMTRQIYSYAMGSEPQILGAEKRGPGEEVELDAANGPRESIVHRQHVTFVKAVEQKILREKALVGWESSAFDL